MNENHQKTGLAAFILSLVGVLTFGIAAIPAIICAVISKNQSRAAGVSTDGFATAAMVISGFMFALWGVVIALLLVGMTSGASGASEWSIFTENSLRVLMVVTGLGIALLLLPKLMRKTARFLKRNHRQVREQRRSMWKLAGRP